MLLLYKIRKHRVGLQWFTSILDFLCYNNGRGWLKALCKQNSRDATSKNFWVTSKLFLFHPSQDYLKRKIHSSLWKDFTALTSKVIIDEIFKVIKNKSNGKLLIFYDSVQSIPYTFFVHDEKTFILTSTTSQVFHSFGLKGHQRLKFYVIKNKNTENVLFLDLVLLKGHFFSYFAVTIWLMHHKTNILSMTRVYQKCNKIREKNFSR